MNGEEAIKIWTPDIERILYDDKLDDSKMDHISEYTYKKVKAWEYIKENLK